MSTTVVQAVPGGYVMPSLRHATVADAMHPGIVSCPPGASLVDAARLMATHRVHCIAVMGISRNGQSERFVWGLISDLDLMRAGIRLGPEADCGSPGSRTSSQRGTDYVPQRGGGIDAQARREPCRRDRLSHTAANRNPLDPRRHWRGRLGRGVTDRHSRREITHRPARVRGATHRPDPRKALPLRRGGLRTVAGQTNAQTRSPRCRAPRRPRRAQRRRRRRTMATRLRSRRHTHRSVHGRRTRCAREGRRRPLAIPVASGLEAPGQTLPNTTLNHESSGRRLDLRPRD